MPPSPSLRVSPGRERTKEVHKRGRSLEHGLSYKPKDDDLLLFADIQSGEKEKESFLLQSSDDFDDSLNKLRFFSEFKPVNIPARGESSDLLNAEGDKNDYDWLLTPPDTPLFPSLDDEEPPPLKVITRGRSQSQTKSLSRSSTMERTQRSSRSSASPSRHSPSPRSTVSTIHSMPRQSSASRASSPSLVCTPTPTRRPATPPTKPSTPTRRSASPTPRRISTGSLSQPKRGISPVKSSRGNSPSPKIRGWDPNPPGFPTETPPNLRTSLPDRPISRSRGLSPASGVGSDLSSRYRRQSMSPTPSRSASSSHSHDRDHFSHSTGDDDIDSMSSFSNSITARKNIGMIKNKTVAVSKKPAKNIITVGSAPKRSFDSALWLMDHRKAPQNMFRPLLSSVPTTSFVTGKASNTSRPMFSRNSSLTTSSNASSEHGATVAPYIDSDHDQVEYPDSESEKIEGFDVHEEVFAFDKVDVLLDENLDRNEELLERPLGDFGREMVEVTCSRCRRKFFIMVDDTDVGLCEECDAADRIAVLQPGVMRDEMARMEISTESEDNLCQKAKSENVPYEKEPIPEFVEVTMKSEDNFHQKAKSENVLYEKEPSMLQPELSSKEIMEESNDLEHSVLERDKEKQMEVLRERVSADLNLDKTTEATAPEVDASGKFVPEEYYTDLEVKDLPAQQISIHAQNERQQPPPDSKWEDLNKEPTISDLGSYNKQHKTEITIGPMHRGENTEGSGISVLLMQRSNSSKWPVVEGRSISATNIHCSEPSYTRDSTSVLKRSLGHQSSSASSSVDLGPFRNTEARLHRLLRNRNKTSGQHVSSFSTGSVSDMSISGSSIHIGPRSDNNEELCNSFDGEYSKGSETASPSISERNVKEAQNISMENEASDVLEASVEEYDERILDVQNEAESEQTEPTRMDSLDESHTSTVSEKNEFATPVESCIVEVSSDNHVELSSAKPEAPKQQKRRSFTLEEATDTILFCSSIVHDLAYNAATIAIEKENASQEVIEESRPTIAAINIPTTKPDSSTGLPVKRIVNARKVKRKRPESENSMSREPEGRDAKGSDLLPATGDGGVHKKEGLKQQPPPAKLEAKCNCTIM
ncbi:RUN/FYVE domain protein [Rhynchospora pubera]|uniref:RUN/FYVE domain protein n=1 Tax=Rhynchospora pubera TaxID=906938 RepID=A0AAV8HSD6_9POAL|nr:RUN/FYVE domain protein [Rhynchospora pubera]